jgi:hypothetical protein
MCSTASTLFEDLHTCSWEVLVHSFTDDPHIIICLWKNQLWEAGKVCICNQNILTTHNECSDHVPPQREQCINPFWFQSTRQVKFTLCQGLRPRGEVEVYLSLFNLGTSWGRRHSGWGIALQTGRSRDWFPMVSLVFFIDIILPAALWPWGWLSL